MPRWLTRASDALRRTTPPVPEPFVRPCVECGASIEGVRQPQAQVLACGSCGAGNFVLPVCPFPPLKEKRRRKRSRSKAAAADTEALTTAETAPIDAVPPVAPTEFGDLPGSATGRSRRGRRRKTTPGTSAGPSARQLPVDGRSPGTATAQATADKPSPAGTDRRIRLPTGGLGGLFGRMYTPVRAIAGGCLVLVVLTTWWATRRRAMEQAAVTVRLAEEEGDRLLAAGDLLAAEMEYTRAVQAVDLLDRADPDAGRVRQKQRELAAVTDLSSSTLMEILEDAAELHAADSESWQEVLALRHANSWFVLDTMLVRYAADAPVEVDLPLAVGDVPVVLDAGLVVFESIPPGQQPQRVLFAAAFDGVEFHTTPEPHWVVRLQPDSGVLLTLPAVCESLGLLTGEDEPVATPQPSLRDVLARQQTWLGLESFSASAGTATEEHPKDDARETGNAGATQPAGATP